MSPDEARIAMAEYCGEERREAHEKWINKVEDHVNKLLVRMTHSENFRGQVKLAFVIIPGILGVVWLGSFIYTYNHKQEAAIALASMRADTEAHYNDLKSSAKDEANKFHRVLNEQAKDLGRLEGKVLVIEDRYIRLLNDIEKLNSNLEKFAQEARQLNQIQRVEIENYKTRNDDQEQQRYPVP